MKTYKRIIKIIIDDQVINSLNHSIILKNEPENITKIFNDPVKFGNFLFEEMLFGCEFRSNRKGEIAKIIFYNWSERTSKSYKSSDIIDAKITIEYKPYKMTLKELSEYPDSTVATQYIKQEYNKTVDEIITEVN